MTLKMQTDLAHRRESMYGYNPGTGDRTSYPVQVQAAEAKVAAQNDQSSYGGVADGSASGSYHAPAHTGATAMDPVYRAH
ncbi:hypothetical protein [Caballeronia sp. M23-90]